MYRKEFIECSRKAAGTLLFFAFIPVLYLIDRFIFDLRLNYMVVILYGIIFVISVVTMMFSFSMFHSEQEDHAMEYLLSMPVSKYSIMGFKLIPRLTILGFFYVFYLLIKPSGMNIISTDQGIFVHPMVLPMVIFVFMIFGFIAGLIGYKNGLSIAFTVITFYAVIGGTAGLAANFIDISKDAFNIDGWVPFFWASSGIVLLILWISFSPVFQRFDLKSGTVHFKRFAFPAFPLMAVYIAVIISSLFIENWIKSWMPILWMGVTVLILFLWVRLSPLFKRIE